MKLGLARFTLLWDWIGFQAQGQLEERVCTGDSPTPKKIEFGATKRNNLSFYTESTAELDGRSTNGLFGPSKGAK